MSEAYNIPELGTRVRVNIVGLKSNGKIGTVVAYSPENNFIKIKIDGVKAPHYVTPKFFPDFYEVVPGFRTMDVEKVYKAHLTAADLIMLRGMRVGIGIRLQDPE